LTDTLIADRWRKRSNVELQSTHPPEL